MNQFCILLALLGLDIDVTGSSSANVCMIQLIYVSTIIPTVF